MTNTRITDAEIMEERYPVLLHQFSVRKNSGGKGKNKGGDGSIRDIQFLIPMTVGILSERRFLLPFFSFQRIYSLTIFFLKSFPSQWHLWRPPREGREELGGEERWKFA